MGDHTSGGGSFTDTPMNMCLKSSYASEPAIIVSKPPAVANLPMKLCCASSAESLDSSIHEVQTLTGPTLLKIKEVSTESGSDLQTEMQNTCSSTGSKPSDSIMVPPPETPSNKTRPVDTETGSIPTHQCRLAADQNITFGQIEIAALSPLHIDSVIFETGGFCSPHPKATNESVCADPVSSHNGSTVGESDGEVQHVNCSRLIDALDIQSPAKFKLGVSSGLQSTPYKLDLEVHKEFVTPPKIGTEISAVHEKEEAHLEFCSDVQYQRPLLPHTSASEKRRVADHIQHFNKLTLLSPRGSRGAHIRSPLKFERTPVRQAVRRINSLLGDSRRPAQSGKPASSQVVKSLSLESGLSPCPQPFVSTTEVERFSRVCPVKKPPPVPPKRRSTLNRKPKACALGDVTNKVQPKSRADDPVPDPSGAQNPLVEQLVEKDKSHYRGSPRNPLNQGRLLSATKPVDL